MRKLPIIGDGGGTLHRSSATVPLSILEVDPLEAVVVSSEEEGVSAWAGEGA